MIRSRWRPSLSRFMRWAAVFPLLAAAGVWGLGRSVGRAAEPAPAAELAPPKPAGSVKEIMKDAVKDVAKDVTRDMGKPSAPKTAPPTGPQIAASDPASRLAMLRKKVLKDDDFVENDEVNRDPFRSYLKWFVEKGVQRTRQVPAIFDKFALEELTLIAIVSGDSNPRAMFRDPAGLGQTIKRGDYVSKAAARITKILSDRVILELNDIAPDGETKILERAILVNPEGGQK